MGTEALSGRCGEQRKQKTYWLPSKSDPPPMLFSQREAEREQDLLIRSQTSSDGGSQAQRGMPLLSPPGPSTYPVLTHGPLWFSTGMSSLSLPAPWELCPAPMCPMERRHVQGDRRFPGCLNREQLWAGEESFQSSRSLASRVSWAPGCTLTSSSARRCF